MAIKPVRLVEAEMTVDESGAGKLKVPLQRTGWTSKLFRLPEGASKTFEFDPIGVLVWENLDGKTSVKQLIRKVGKHCKVSDREAALATNQFLQMLGRKSLIGLALEKDEGKAEG